MKKFYSVFFSLTLLLGGALPVQAAYPEKEIVLLVGWAAGGGTDLIARKIASIAEKELGKPIIIQNKPGGAGAVSFQQIATSKPDGYLLGMTTTPLLLQKYFSVTPVPYQQMTHIAIVNEDPSAITVPANAPWKTAQEFVEFVQKNPGKVRISNAGPGSAWHAMALRFEKTIGSKVVHVPYEGGNPAAVAAAGGHVEATFVSPAEVASLVAANKVRILAVSSEERDPNYPYIPTFQEIGINLSGGVHRAISAPKGLSPEVLQKLETAFHNATNTQEYKDFMKTSGLGMRYISGPALLEYLDRLDQEYEQLFKK